MRKQWACIYGKRKVSWQRGDRERREMNTNLSDTAKLQRQERGYTNLCMKGTKQILNCHNTTILLKVLCNLNDSVQFAGNYLVQWQIQRIQKGSRFVLKTVVLINVNKNNCNRFLFSNQKHAILMMLILPWSVRQSIFYICCFFFHVFWGGNNFFSSGLFFSNCPDLFY